jgi:hypothetical protein
MNMQKKIDYYINQFETKKRGEDTITVFKDNATQELKNSVYKAHGDRLPTDWIFDKYLEILEDLSNYTINSIDDVEEYRSEIVDGLVDVYTSDLTSWLNSSNYNVYYIEESQKEYGAQEDGFKMLSMAQYKAIDDIYSYVISLLSE